MMYEIKARLIAEDAEAGRPVLSVCCREEFYHSFPLKSNANDNQDHAAALGGTNVAGVSQSRVRG